MRKWLYIVSVIVIAGLLSISYYITGVRAEKEFNKFLESANDIPNLTITADNYRRGWLKSTVHINAVLRRPEQQYTQNGVTQTLPSQDISFSFNTAIYHGPIIIANNQVAFGLGYARAEVPLPNEVLTEFNKVFTANSTKPIFIVSLLLQYREKLNVDFDVPHFALVSKDGLVTMNWRGFKSHWKMWAKVPQTKGDLDFKGLTFKLADTNGDIGSAHLKYDVKNTPHDILSGKVAIALKDFQLMSSNQLPIIIQGFQAVSESHVKDNLVDSALKADLNKVTYEGLDYGPGVLSMALSNLDALTLNRLQQQLQAASNSNLTEAQQQVFLLTLLPELPKLLGKGAEFKIKQFQLSIPQGVIEATAKITFPDQQNTNQNPLQLVNQIHAKAAAEVPVTWLNELMANFLKVKIQQRQLMQQQIAEENSDSLHKEESKDKTKPSLEQSAASIELLTPQQIDTMAKQQASDQLTNLVQNGVLIQKDGIYSIKINFKDGAFTVNGQPFNGNVIQ